VRIAFYAPLKSPSHQTPSGDRRMGRLLIAALEAAGHAVGLASDFRSFEGAGDAGLQKVIEAAAKTEADHLLATYGAAKPEELPEIWFTYHLYYKAPDLLGPVIAAALDIPYVVAEPSYAPKRAGGPWDRGHRQTGEAISAAHAVLCLTRLDMACVTPLIGQKERLYHLPPFLDVTPYIDIQAAKSRARQDIADRFDIDLNAKWLIAVGMMRPGDKFESYRRLAAALQALEGDDWRLLTVGDGAARADVATLFDDFAPGRVVHLGAVPPEQMPETVAAADVFVWPAAGEAYGMAMLEAQAAGVPVIAGNVRGVPEVVRDGVSAELVAENEPALFAGAIRRLLDDDERRQQMSLAARQFVQNERTIADAGKILNRALASAISQHRTRP